MSNPVLACATVSNNKFVVNISVGDPSQVFDSTSACLGRNPWDTDPFKTQVANAIRNLTSRGVPVVAATGNGSPTGSRNGIGWPACLPSVVKVAAVANDTSGTTLAEFSHIGDPNKFGNDPILLAPGGSNTTAVTSASGTGTTTGTLAMNGTSQATPHVSSLLAAYKAVVPTASVADAIAWIKQPGQPGSVDVAIDVGFPLQSKQFRRVRVPNNP